MTEILKKIYDNGLDDTTLINLSENFSALREFELKDLASSIKSSSDSFDSFKGLSKDIDKSEDEVVERITYSKYLNEFLKIFPRKAKSGEVLITTKSKYEQSATFKDKFIDAFATSRVRLK